MSSHQQLVKSAPPYAEQAHRVIRSLILDGVYRPGEQLAEVALSQTLGISRSPIREAFHRLANEGLVELVSRKGAFVSRFDGARVESLFEVREALQGMAARLAAARASDDDVRELQRTLGSTKSFLDMNGASSYPLDLDFHRQLARIARNPSLTDKAAEIELQVYVARRRSGARALRVRDAYREHVDIFEAVRDHEPDRAESAMRAHIRNALASVRQAIDEPGR